MSRRILGVAMFVLVVGVKPVLAERYGNLPLASVNVTLADLEPPSVGSVTATPALLWPPNREMISVAVTVADVSDACSGAVTCRIDTVTSNEPLAADDWAITGALTIQLRADRRGDGTGRIYTIGITCTDAAGNSTRKTVTVRVPHEI